MGRFASGVTVVTTKVDSTTHGMTANAFISVSLNPPLVLVSVDNRAHLKRLLLVGRYFGVSVLAENQVALSDHFAGREVEGVDVSFVEELGVPLLEGAIAHLVANVVQVVKAGDHTLFIGHVEYLDARDDEEPLLFYAGGYRRIALEKLALLEWPEDEHSMFSIGNFTWHDEAGEDS